MFKRKVSKGFTLIELLAVIVVLAVIALISIPIITNVIEKAKKGSVKSSAYGLVEAGQLYYANNLSKGISEDIEFTCSGSKCIKDDKEITYKGDIDSGILKLYTDGKITLCIEKDNYGAYKLAADKEVTVEKGTCNDNYKVDAYISQDKYDDLKKEYAQFKTDVVNKINNPAITTGSSNQTIVNAIETTGQVIEGTLVTPASGGNIQIDIGKKPTLVIVTGYNVTIGSNIYSLVISSDKLFNYNNNAYGMRFYNGGAPTTYITNFIEITDTGFIFTHSTSTSFAGITLNYKCYVL